MLCRHVFRRSDGRVKRPSAFLRSGQTLIGQVTEMTSQTVKVDMSGVPKTAQVNQIEYIQYDDEPKELTKARTLSRRQI